MENIKYMNIKIEVKRLDKFRDKLTELGGEFEKLKNNLSRIDEIVEEINQMELIVDTSIDRGNDRVIRN